MLLPVVLLAICLIVRDVNAACTTNTVVDPVTAYLAAFPGEVTALGTKTGVGADPANYSEAEFGLLKALYTKHLTLVKTLNEAVTAISDASQKTECTDYVKTDFTEKADISTAFATLKTNLNNAKTGTTNELDSAGNTPEGYVPYVAATPLAKPVIGSEHGPHLADKFLPKRARRAAEKARRKARKLRKLKRHQHEKQEGGTKKRHRKRNGSKKFRKGGKQGLGNQVNRHKKNLQNQRGNNGQHNNGGHKKSHHKKITM